MAIATDASDLCNAVEAQLRANVGPVIAALGLASLLETPSLYQQDPEVQALINADFPAVGIASGGTNGEMERQRSSGTWSTAFSVEIIVIDRGYDHDVTQLKARKWATVVKGALLLDESLGGIADGLKPSGESYLPPITSSAAFTSAVSLTFDIRLERALNVTALREAITSSPTVDAVAPTVSLHPNTQE